jgi:hypothetical protein
MWRGYNEYNEIYTVIIIIIKIQEEIKIDLFIKILIFYI